MSEAASAPELPAATVPAPRPRTPWWRHSWALISGAVAVIGAVTGVIGVWPLLFRDATTLDALTVSVASADSELAPVFAVPATADWASFPASASACDADQLAWLKANGEPLAQRYLVSVANVASEGSMLSLKDFRGDGDPAAAATHVAVTCDRSGGGESNIRSAVLDPASERTAVYVQANPDLPDNPLVFNLAPGENGQFVLLVRSTADFAGTIVFTEAMGSQTREVELPVEGGIDVPGIAAIRLTVADGRLVCAGAEACVPDDVIASLR